MNSPRSGASAPARSGPFESFARFDAAALILFLLAFAILKRAFGPIICDDAYITLAHARSWAAGLRPIMSALNPVCATSTPLHTMVLAGEARVLRSADFPALVYFTNLAWDLVGFFFLHRIAALGLRLSRPMVWIAVSAYGLSVGSLAVSAYGMETPMYVALALAGAWFGLYASGHQGITRVTPSGNAPTGVAPAKAEVAGFAAFCAFCFFAPLTRPEGILLPAALVFLRLRGVGENPRRWRDASLAATSAVLGLIAFFFFYRYAYGRWLPHSVVAKRLEIHVGFFEGLQSWLLNLFYKGPCLGGATLVTLANLAISSAAAYGFYRNRKVTESGTGAARSGPPWALLAWPALYFLFFLATRSSYILFTWYYLPVLPFLILFLCAGLDRLSGVLFAESAPKVLRAACLLFIAAVPLQTFRQHVPQKHRFAEAAREGRYREAARILDSLSNPAKPLLVMIDEVGALGYFSHVRILDMHGLLSPEAVPYLHAGPNAADAESYFVRMAGLQEKEDPDWIMGMRLVKDEGTLYPGEDALYSGYELARTLRLPPHPYVVEMWRRSDPD